VKRTTSLSQQSAIFVAKFLARRFGGSPKRDTAGMTINAGFPKQFYETPDYRNTSGRPGTKPGASQSGSALRGFMASQADAMPRDFRTHADAG
jgi:hypothetical protein